MAWDAHANFAISAVATAPSPANSGTSLIVTAGHGTRFPTAPFNAVVWPSGSSPDPSNAEIVRVTARSTDTLTITRAQESSSARTIVVGDQIAAGITRKTVSDIEDRITAKQRTGTNPAAAATATLPGVRGGGASTSSGQSYNANRCWYFPIFCEDYTTFDQISLEVTTATAGGNTGRVALYAADASWQPTGTLIEDFGTFATDSLGSKTVTPSGGSRTLPPGRYLLALNNSISTTYRIISAAPAQGMFLASPLGSAAFRTNLYVTGQTYGAFPSTPVAWTLSDTGSAAFSYPMVMRVTGVG